MKTVIQIGRKKVSPPMKWSELTQKQLISVCKYFGGVIFPNQNDKIDEGLFYAAKMMIIKSFLKLRWWTFIKIDTEQFAELLQLTDFLDGKVDLDTQLFPTIKVGRTVYHGPLQGLKNSSFSEFIYADTFFVLYSKDSKIEYLYKMIAAMYRPAISESLKNDPLWNGDLRAPFNENRIDEYAKLIQEKVPEDTIYACLFFYWGFRNQHLLKFKEVFPEKTEKQIQHESTQKRNAGPQWINTAMEMAGGIHGTFKETMNESWFTIMMDLQQQIKKSREK
jgi:hypothetical protein